MYFSIAWGFPSHPCLPKGTGMLYYQTKASPSSSREGEGKLFKERHTLHDDKPLAPGCFAFPRPLSLVPRPWLYSRLFCIPSSPVPSPSSLAVYLSLAVFKALFLKLYTTPNITFRLIVLLIFSEIKLLPIFL